MAFDFFLKLWVCVTFSLSKNKTTKNFDAGFWLGEVIQIVQCWFDYVEISLLSISFIGLDLILRSQVCKKG